MNGSAFVLTINYIAEKNYRQCFFEAFFSVKIKKIMFNTMPNAVAMVEPDRYWSGLRPVGYSYSKQEAGGPAVSGMSPCSITQRVWLLPLK